MTYQTVYYLSAELLLLVVAVSIYLAGAFAEARPFWSRVALVGFAAAGLLLAATGSGRGLVGLGATGTLGTAAVFDPTAAFFRWLAVGIGVALVLALLRNNLASHVSEYVGSLILAVVGLMTAAVAGNIVLMFVGLELISIPTYALLFLGRRDDAGREATAKYFYLSVLSSALFLYGLSFLYGATGSTDLDRVAAVLASSAPGAGAVRLAKVAMVLIFAGLGFRIAAVPFHFYAPDVYEGTSHFNAAFLSVVPKAAGMVALIRLAVAAMPNLEPYAWRLAVVLALVTMTLGNLLALWQDNLRRLLAYSSIAHTGYMLIGLAVGLSGARSSSWDGIAALLFYLCAYAVATIGIFAALIYLGRDDRQVETVGELSGLGRDRPWTALLLAVFLFSLTGIPPLAGFWGKLSIFASALGVDAAGGTAGSPGPWFVMLAVAGVLNSAVAAAYYLRIIAGMYFRPALAALPGEGGAGAWLSALGCGVLVVALGLRSGPLMDAATAARPPAALPVGLRAEQPAPSLNLIEADARRQIAATSAGQ